MVCFGVSTDVSPGVQLVRLGLSRNSRMILLYLNSTTDVDHAFTLALLVIPIPTAAVVPASTGKITPVIHRA